MCVCAGHDAHTCMHARHMCVCPISSGYLLIVHFTSAQVALLKAKQILRVGTPGATARSEGKKKKKEKKRKREGEKKRKGGGGEKGGKKENRDKKQERQLLFSLSFHPVIG